VIKLSDIAAELGVSTATISNALTGKGRMKEDTRQHIREVALSMGYEIPAASRGQKSQIIVIAEAAEVTFTAETICGISMAAREADTSCAVYDLCILKAGPGRDATADQLRPLIENCIMHHPVSPSCIIYIAQYPRHLPGLLTKLNVPCVEVCCYGTGAQATVSYDDQQGAYLAVSHLIANGHKRIAMLSGPVDSHSVSDRMIGYQRALIDHGLTYHPKLVWIGDWEAKSGRDLTRDLLMSSNRPDAIFAQNDTMACGAIQAAQEMGLHVPEDVAVVGFDNTMFANWIIPSLSSVNPPFHEIGQKAFALAQQLIAGQPIQERQIKVPCNLVIRSSSTR